MTEKNTHGGVRDGAGRFGRAGESKTKRIPIAYEKAVDDFMDFLDGIKHNTENKGNIMFKNLDNVSINISLISIKKGSKKQ